MEIVTYPEGFSLLQERVSKTNQNEAKERKAGFLSMLSGTLGARFLGNILAGKGINKHGEEIVRAGYGNEKGQKARKKDKIVNRKWIFNVVLPFN